MCVRCLMLRVSILSPHLGWDWQLHPLRLHIAVICWFPLFVVCRFYAGCLQLHLTVSRRAQDDLKLKSSC